MIKKLTLFSRCLEKENCEDFTEIVARPCKKGFTLAEVLITLAIIGVVAALTIPNMINGYREKVTVVSLKKAYSILANACLLAIDENGTPDNWGLSGFWTAQSALTLLNTVVPYLKVSKNCGTSPGCFPNVAYKYLSGGNELNLNTDSRRAQVILNDGMLLDIWVESPTCTATYGGSIPSICATFTVDVNGFKLPNQYGKDTFSFYLTKTSVVPLGLQGLTGANAHAFETGCIGTSPSGYGCTAWVIQNENMDYLRCKNLSWNGKTKCK